MQKEELKSYRLVLEMDVDATSPKSAAEIGLDVINQGLATVFAVYEWTALAEATPVSYVDALGKEEISQIPQNRNF